jgi:hypothetical protein
MIGVLKSKPNGKILEKDKVHPKWNNLYDNFIEDCMKMGVR